MSLLSSNKKEKKAKEPKAKKVKEPKAKKVKEPKAKKTKAKKGQKGEVPVDSDEMPDFSEVAEKPVKEKKVYPTDVYTLVLLVAWIALTAACVLAYLDIASYK